MDIVIINSLYIFCVVLEGILFLYILSTWIRISPKIQGIFNILLDPLLDPIRYLLKHSIFQVRNYDLSPIIGFLVLSYLQEFFYALR
ncbi:YggT family protein [Mobilisporobacter senegalensis]|uniref:YggT family protein n=1 Tax=Mobilisporobacter senegalensis TaxID=1329262 RepID=UPI000F4A398B